MIEINGYELDAPLGGAPWFVHAFAYPGRVSQVEILSAAEAAETFAGGESAFFAGQIWPAKSRKNAERLARRVRQECGAHEKVGAKSWRNEGEWEDWRRLTPPDAA